jgi:hypothetical protein
MAITQNDIDSLNEAIALGERVVRKANGETVEYRSVADLIRARDDLSRQLTADQRPRRQVYLVQGGRGF